MKLDRPQDRSTIKAEQEAFIHLSDVSNDLYLILSDEGEIEYVNDSFLKSLSYKREDVLGKNLLDYLHSEDDQFADRATLLKNLKEKGNLTDLRVQFIKKDGSFLWHSITASNRKNNWYVCARDINELIYFDQELIKERERFKFFTESSFEGIALEIDGKIVDCNKMYLSIFEAEEDEILKQDGNKFLILDDIEKWNALFKNEEIKSYEVQAKTAKGNLIYIEVYRKPAYHKGFKGKLVAVRDITQRKNLEEELASKNNLHKSIVDSPHILFGTLDTRGRVIELSNGLLNFLDTNIEKVKGKPIHEVFGFIIPNEIDPDSLLKSEDGKKLLVLNPGVQEFETEITITDAKGALVILQLSISNLGKEQDGQLVVFKDVTDLKENILKLELTEEELRNTIKSAKLASWHYDFDNWVLRLSPESKNILDLESLELPFDEFISKIHPDDIDETIAHLQKSIEGEEFSCDTRIVLNGKTNYIHLQGFRSSRSISGLHKPTIKGFFQDITKRKQEEIELKEAKLKAEQHTRAKNLFLANMSHEIRTPLNSILGFAQILEKKIENNDAKNLLSSIKNSGDTLLKLINDILDLSKIESSKITLHKETFTIQKLVSYQESLFKNIAQDKAIDFSINLDIPSSKVFKADFYRLNQVLMNLINNAIKFTPKGKVSLDISYKDGDKSKLNFKVIDTGIGIDAKGQQQIFKTFEQANSEITKNFGGTGLGLAIVKGLIELMDGEIEVRSELGKGTTFEAWIAVDNIGHAEVESIGEIELDNSSNLNIERPFRVLLAEDNPTNQLLMQEVFAQLDLEYEIAEDGTKALDLLKKNHQFHLGIFDIQMPQMDGSTAVKIIRSHPQLYPQFPIIALTADATTQERKHALKNGFNGFLPKPFKISDLILNINALMNKDNILELGKNSQIKKDNSLNLDWSWKLDMTYIEDVTQHSTDAIIKILGRCCESLPDRIDLMKQALIDENVKKIVDEAHAIKGQITLFISKEDQELVARCYNKIRSIEKINDTQKNLINTLVAELQHLTNLLKGQLKNYEEKIGHSG